MATNRLRRIAKEIDETASDTFSKVILRPAGDSDDISHLEGSFQGPPETPYEGGTFKIDIIIPSEYPFRPPKMKFKTKIWHPNVSSVTVSSFFFARVLAGAHVLTYSLAGAYVPLHIPPISPRNSKTTCQAPANHRGRPLENNRAPYV